MTDCIKHLKILDSLPDEVMSKSDKKKYYNRIKDFSKDGKTQDSAKKLIDEIKDDLSPKARQYYRSKLLTKKFLVDQKLKMDKYKSKERYVNDLLEKGIRSVESNKMVPLMEFTRRLNDKNKNLLPFLQKESNEGFLLEAADDLLNKSASRDGLPQEAKDIMSIYFDISDDTYKHSIALGGTGQKLNDHLAIQSHDRSLMGSPFKSRFTAQSERIKLLAKLNSPSEVALRFRKMAKDKWVNFIKPRLNLERTFGKLNDDGTHTLEMSPSEVHKALEDGYDKIMFGKEDSVNVSPGAYSSDREYHFKSKKDSGDYNRQYGSGTLYKSMMKTLERNGRKIGLIKTFSPRPQEFYKGIIDHLKKTMSDKEKVKLNDKKINRYEAVKNALFGASDRPEEHLMDSIYRGLQAQTYLTTLGLSGINSIPDLNIQMTRYLNTGAPFYKRVGYTLQDMSHALPLSKERKWVLENVHGVARDSSASLANYFGGPKNPLMPTFMKWFFNANLQHPIDNFLRSRSAKFYSKHIMQRLDMDFDKIDPTFQKTLKMYGIDDKYWKMLQENKDKFDVFRNKKFVIPSAVLNFSKESIERYAGEPLSDRKLSQLKRDLSSNLVEMYYDNANHIQINPNEYDRANVGINNIKNPYIRFFSKFMMTFKWFSFKSIKSVLGDIYTANTTDTLWNSFKDAPISAHMNLMQYVAGSAVMGYATHALGQLLTQGTVDSPEDHPWKTLINELAAPLGILRTVTAAAGRSGQLDWNTVMGPAGKLLWDDINLVKNISMYDSQGKRQNYHDYVTKSLLNYSNRHLMLHLPWTERLYQNHLFIPMMNRHDPGYLRREQMRDARENPNRYISPFLGGK